MRRRVRQRVNWDEELNKTERIRHRGIFISGLSFAASLAFIFGAGRMSPGGVEISRKVVFTLCLMLALFLMRMVFRRRERIVREQEEREDREAVQELRRWREEKNLDKWLK